MRMRTVKGTKVQRPLGGLATGTLVVALLSGCSVPYGAILALGMAPDGDIVAHLQICEGHIDGVSVFRADEGDISKPSGVWDAATPVLDTAAWSLVDPRDGWTASTPLAPLEPGVQYDIYGWTVDNSWSAIGPSPFTVDDLRQLQPGQVLSWNKDWASADDAPLTVAMDLAVFTETACD
jgi:hypothetical protein